MVRRSFPPSHHLLTSLPKWGKPLPSEKSSSSFLKSREPPSQVVSMNLNLGLRTKAGGLMPKTSVQRRLVIDHEEN